VSHTTIDGSLLKKMIISAANELNQHKQQIDALNVFPVPDGDTGTNMSLTITTAAKEVGKSSSERVSDMCSLAASGSLRGARGNSGVILSQLIRGFSKALEENDTADMRDLAHAAKKGVKTAYKAVMKPKEGTILTVARICADAAEHAAAKSPDIESFLEKILEEGHIILEQTKEMLPVLKQADVVDAGGMGLLFVLEGALKALRTEGDIELAQPGEQTAAEPVFKALSTVETADIKFGYCTELFINLIKGADRKVPEFREYLDKIGDSIVVVNDEELVKVHVHTNHPGRVLEQALLLGSLTGLKIENMREQHTQKIEFDAAEAAAAEKAAKPPKEHKETGFIAVSVGEGLAKIFRNLGVDEMIEGGQTMNPSTEDILNAIDEVDADNIVILPNNSNIILAAEQASKLTENKKVFVIPTKSVPEGIAAMLNFSADESIEESVETMAEAAKEVLTGSVTYAVRDTTFGEKEIHEGDILCMLGGEIAVIAKDPLEGAKLLLHEAITEDNDIIGIYYGSDVTKEEAEALVEYAEENFPDCEIELQEGGQPLYYYIISIE